MSRRALPLLALSLCSCALQAGGYLGRTWHARRDPDPDAWTWGGQLQAGASLVLCSQRWQASGLLEGRTEEPRGGVSLWGVEVGPVLTLSERMQLVPAIDLGLPTGFSGRVNGYFGGVVLGLPLLLGAVRDAAAVNRDYRFVDENGFVVPFVNIRYYHLGFERGVRDHGYEVSLGLAVRMQVVTDLIEL